MANSRLLLGLVGVGVSLCVACGSSFSGASAGGAGGGSSAGETSGGADGAGAPGSDGGSAPTAGSQSGGGETSAGGPGAGSGGTTGTAGAASAGSGGASAGAGGSAGAVDCVTLKTEYQADLDKAKVCDKGSTTECSKSSTMAGLGCGCPVLVNATSEATALAKKKYQQLQDGKCLGGGVTCNIACAAYLGASCSQQAMGSGDVYVCTASAAIAN